MKKFLTSLITSKKAIATVVAVVVAFAAKKGLDLDAESVTAIVGSLMAYVVGQGIADAGKEKARVERGETK